MNIEKYPYHCSQCGASLTRQRGKIFCEYCGLVYFDASMDNENGNIEESLIENPGSQADMEENSHKSLSPNDCSADVIDNAEEPNINNRKELDVDDHYVIPLIVLLAILFLSGMCFSNTPFQYDDGRKSHEIKSTLTAYVTQQGTLTEAAAKRNVTETAIHKRSLIELIYQNKYSGTIFPADSNEDLPVATALALEYADANNLIFSLFVHNQSGKDIDPSSLQEHLEIDSLAVTSDLQDKFLCSLQKDNWDEELFLRGHTKRKGMINCSGSLNPESLWIVIDFDMPNWGSSHLEIPIHIDNEDLQSSIELELAPESYSISVELHSEQPQLVWVKKSDIIINDDKGITMLLDGCTPNTSQQGAGEYFLKLTYPSGYDDKFIICQYDEPFPSEINTLRASMKTTAGKIFKSQAVVNKSEGTIHFSNETAE